MHITALAILMRKIAAPGAELSWAASVLHENAAAVLAFDWMQLLSIYLFRMRFPPRHTALGRTETLLPMPGRLLK